METTVGTNNRGNISGSSLLLRLVLLRVIIILGTNVSITFSGYFFVFIHSITLFNAKNTKKEIINL